MKRYLFLFLVLLLTTGISSAFAGGDGTEEDPYQISNIEELDLSTSDNLTVHYEIINDIDANDYSFTGIGIDNEGEIERFGGSIDGNGNTISNLDTSENSVSTNNDDAQSGFIGETDEGATISNINLENYEGDNGLVGNVQGLTNIEAIQFSNSYIQNPDGNYGFIAGFVEGTTLEVQDIEVIGSSIDGYHDFGFIVGDDWAADSIDISNVLIRESDISASQAYSIITSADHAAVTMNDIAVDGATLTSDFDAVQGLAPDADISDFRIEATTIDGGDPSFFITENSGSSDGYVADSEMTGASTDDELFGVANDETVSGVENVYHEEGILSHNSEELTTNQMTGSDAETNMNLDFENTWETTTSYPELQFFAEEEDSTTSTGGGGGGEIDNYVAGQTAEFPLNVSATGQPDQEYEDGNMTEYYVKDVVIEGGDINETDGEIEGGKIIQESSWEQIEFPESDGSEDIDVQSEREFSVTRYQDEDYTAVLALAQVDGTYNFETDSWELTEEEVDRHSYSWTVTEAESPESPLQTLINFFGSLLESMTDTFNTEFEDSPIGVPSVDNPPSGPA